MPGGRKKLPKRTCPSLYGGRGEQEVNVEEQAGREEEPSWTEELSRSRRLRQRRLEFVMRTTTTMTGDGGSGGSRGGGDDDDDEGHDARCGGGGGGHDDEDECHGAVVPSSGLRKPYKRGPLTLPTQKPLPHQRKVIAPVGKE
jgi:hypothetical protein